MSEQTFVVIGHTRKAHGLTGELKVSIEDRYLEDFLKNERIFINFKGSKMPYFIAGIRGKGEIILQLEEVDDRDAAIALQSKEIFLRTQDLLKDDEREFDVEETPALEYGYLTGFQIIDKTAGEIGCIEEVLEMPQQEMAMVKFKGREVLIPLNKILILTIDNQKNTITMDLPEGLLDM
ncbi:MAG: 16S rRNA processing protein RimM [Saprospiraceae bacterium]|nr:16S rRNA processing protein RimM [Saprospiraceae bacterium]